MKIKVLSLALVAVLLNGCFFGGGSGGLPVNSPAPFTKFQKLDGSYILLDELKGKHVVVLFWAQWCARSRSTIKKVNQFARDFKGRSDIVYIAASVDKSENGEKVRELIRFEKLTHINQAYSGNDIYDEAYMAFDVDELPHVFIIDPSGKIVATGHNDGVVKDYFEKK